MNKLLKYFLIIIGSLSIAVFQISFFNNFNLYYLYFIIIVIITFIDYDFAIIFALCLGIFLDLLNFTFLGPLVISLPAVVILLNYLFLNFLTHKNFLTYLALITIGFLFINILLVIFNVILFIFGQHIIDINFQFFFHLANQLLISLAVFILLYLVYFIAKKFKSNKSYVH